MDYKAKRIFYLGDKLIRTGDIIPDVSKATAEELIKKNLAEAVPAEKPPDVTGKEDTGGGQQKAGRNKNRPNPDGGDTNAGANAGTNDGTAGKTDGSEELPAG